MKKIPKTQLNELAVKNEILLKCEIAKREYQTRQTQFSKMLNYEHIGERSKPLTRWFECMDEKKKENNTTVQIC